jgi:hypothetical protein
MNSNNLPLQNGFKAPSQFLPLQRAAETTLRIERIQIDQKEFRLILKENERGRFLRIIEQVNGRRNAIIVPSTGFEEMSRILQEMVCAHQQPGPSLDPLV